MSLHDSSCHPEPESGPGRRFGGRERFADIRQKMRADARSGIGNHHAGSAFVFVVSASPVDANHEPAVAGERIESISNDTGERLTYVFGKAVEFLES